MAIAGIVLSIKFYVVTILKAAWGAYMATGRMDRAEWTRIATRAVSLCACRAQVPNPFVAKCFGFPSSAWARQIYLLSERTSERATDGAQGPAIGAADFTGQRVGDRRGLRCRSFPV